MPKRKTKRKKLIDQLDQITKEIIRIRDNHTCQWCGKKVSGSDEQCSHVIPRSRGNHLRWDLENCKILCMHCHMHKWHKDPLASWQWFSEKFPERAEYLESQAHTTNKFTIQELEELLQKRKKQLQEMTDL